MNLFNIVRDEIVKICSELGAKENWLDINYNAINAEQPKNLEHGDIASNAAMIIASQAKQNPRIIAEKLVAKLTQVKIIKTAAIAGPGFINILLHDELWFEQLKHIGNGAEEYAKTNIGNGKKVNIEFVSVNPTGPMHIGHARGAVYGDALSSLMSFCGYKVVKEYYVNDAGAQINVLANSVYCRYLELFGKFNREFAEDSYPGEYLIPPAEKLKSIHGDKLLNIAQEEREAIIKPFIIDEMMQLIRHDLSLIGVHHEVFTNESELHNANMIEKLVKLLEQKGLVYRGVLEPPKGMKLDDWEAREQLLFKTNIFGDDIDRPLQKSDGNWTYFAADIAYMKHKLDRKFDSLIILLGADHGGYVKRLKAAAKSLSDDSEIDIKICQLVNYLKDGQPFKMSKRKGTFVTVKDIVDIVGKDIIRFIMLNRKNDIPMDFDFDKVIEQSKDNPVFYVQYAHARAKSVMRNAKETCPKGLEIFKQNKANLNLITTTSEKNLIKILASFPKQVEQAALSHEPHRIAYFLEMLAAEFHGLWTKGRDENIKFIIAENPELTAARLTLVDATSKIIKAGLKLIGVQATDSM